VLCHRIVIDYHARVEGRSQAEIVHDLLAEIPFQAQPTPKSLIPNPS